MFTIVCNSQKGGSGKSALSRVLAVQASRLGKSVYLIDTDTQGTLTQWHEAREAEEEEVKEAEADDDVLFNRRRLPSSID